MALGNWTPASLDEKSKKNTRKRDGCSRSCSWHSSWRTESCDPITQCQSQRHIPAEGSLSCSAAKYLTLAGQNESRIKEMK